MAEHLVTVCVKVTVTDVEAPDQLAADQIITEDVLTRFPVNWAVEEIPEPN